MGTHKTRLAVMSDAQAIGDVSFRSAKDENLAYHVEWWTYYLGDEARAAGHRVFVAELDGSDDGFTLVGPLEGYDFVDEPKCLGAEEEVAVLYSIHVDPTCIGQGFGKDLMVVCVDYLRTAGFRAVVLETDVTRERARRFYEADGWILVETLRSTVIYQLQLD